MNNVYLFAPNVEASGNPIILFHLPFYFLSLTFSLFINNCHFLLSIHIQNREYDHQIALETWRLCDRVNDFFISRPFTKHLFNVTIVLFHHFMQKFTMLSWWFSSSYIVFVRMSYEKWQRFISSPPSYSIG